MTDSLQPTTTYNAWPHRWAVVLCCAVFLLIVVGALVTTYDAGMAVPDWPTTYGYNMFAYPWQTWLYGPLDILVEHGHRLLGSLAGMLTIGLVVSAFWTKQSRLIKGLALTALVAVIAQGLLGGLRVLFDARMIALVHGCTGPAYFALCAAIAVVTSRTWQSPPEKVSAHQASFAAALLATALVYVQLILGATLRHLPVDADPSFFRAAVLFHAALAVVLTIQVGLLAWRVRRQYPEVSWVRRPAGLLAALVAVQVLLGLSTYVLKYSFPAALAQFDFAAGYTVTANGPPQTLVTTAHVAVGSLILATAVVLSVRTGRLAKAAGYRVPFELSARGLAA